MGITDSCPYLQNMPLPWTSPIVSDNFIFLVTQDENTDGILNSSPSLTSHFQSIRKIC